MKINRDLLSGFSTLADIQNTLNGGISLTNLKTSKGDNSYIVKVTAPGVSKESFHVRINNDQLIIYTILGVFSEEESLVKSSLNIPSFIKTYPIPYFINTEEINAVSKDGELQVILPFNEKAKGFEKEVDIKFV